MFFEYLGRDKLVISALRRFIEPANWTSGRRSHEVSGKMLTTSEVNRLESEIILTLGQNSAPGGCHIWTRDGFYRSQCDHQNVWEFVIFGRVRLQIRLRRLTRVKVPSSHEGETTAINHAEKRHYPQVNSPREVCEQRWGIGMRESPLPSVSWT